MTTKSEDLEQYSPDKVLASFNRGSVTRSIVIAVGLHLVIVVGTSVGLVWDRWIDPEGAEQRRQAAEQRVREERDRQQAADATAREKARAKAKPDGKTKKGEGKKADDAATGSGAAASKSEQQMLEERKDAKIVKDVTDVKKPPQSPDDLPLDLGDTN